MTTVAVVGGGITGLTAAYRLRRELGAHADIVLLEPGRLGGKLRTEDLAGGPVDLGAEAFIARRPEVPELLAELGLADEIRYPSGLTPLVWSQGGLRAIPTRTLMGIPSSAESVAGLVDAATVERIRREPETPVPWAPGTDIDVHTLVASRFGEQVVYRSVDPMLGGVYSGRSDTIGVRAALPALAAALDGGAASLTEAVAEALPEPRPGPVFGALERGYGSLLDALYAAAAPRLVHAAATRISRSDGRWVVDPVGAVDGIVLAVPAPAVAALLGDVSPLAASAAARIPLASSAVVALALPTDDGLPQNTGILVASDSPLTPDASAKAFTLSSRKWPHLAERDVTLVRASYGRFGDDAIVDAPDDTLVATARRDLALATGADGEPVAARVQRWHGGLPQYGPGHTEDVAELEAALAAVPRVEVAGALLHGVGVPACIATARTAVTRLLADLTG
ncbi:protoporphyrinogen oxidase [Rhodococcus rhodnii]|uniref:Protoporphyrinogen oxidase n=2 Tax=Rhodococcus rhodnii TaxID=38312 RepID=R7WPF3_9NOCA|nr:protoporphyrinogen oxidase [Rhodococcus rhodnii]EOM75849.1 protoporphyrinogen oxidase [Rhodococcus rhodnii LMG 5362]TXG91022.1 protoporphyrinogen oxidase [Rhodococcus rhodnii]